jgi:hypothetical protein
MRNSHRDRLPEVEGGEAEVSMHSSELVGVEFSHTYVGSAAQADACGSAVQATIVDGE